MGQYWGYHLVMDCKSCDISAVTNPDLITKFVKELVVAIDMVPYGEPQVVHFAKDDPEKAGWTAIQLIETSNIMIHFLDKGDAYFDLFSCKPYDVTVVDKLFRQYFNPASIRPTILTRQA